jgi:hypothetical protein
MMVHHSNGTMAIRTRHVAVAPLIEGTIRSLNGDCHAVRVLAQLHARLWRLEDQARSSRIPGSALVTVKRSIDRWNGMRHRLIDRIDSSIPVRSRPDAVVGRRCSETFGELTDRLIILQLKINHARLSLEDAKLAPATRLRCYERTMGFELWWEYLCDVLREQATEFHKGSAVLPPRAEFKMYNDRELNPVMRAENAPQSEVAANVASS